MMMTTIAEVSFAFCMSTDNSSDLKLNSLQEWTELNGNWNGDAFEVKSIIVEYQCDTDKGFWCCAKLCGWWMIPETW